MSDKMKEFNEKDHMHFHDEDCDCEECQELEFEFSDDDVYEMTDEDGNTVKVALLCVCEIETGEYALMLPIEDNGKELCQDDCDFIVFKIRENGEETLFEAVESDEELDAAVAEFERLMDEAEDKEEK